jgi:hypothetical protein
MPHHYGEQLHTYIFLSDAAEFWSLIGGLDKVIEIIWALSGVHMNDER